jgi:lipopolysaccharide export LptBFGC system permease protein LptF
MKIIDRYVLGMFIKNYLISFMVLIGMYVALDMVFNFGNLTQSRGQSLSGFSIFRIIYDICDYYFYQAFFFFVQLSGVIAVVAAAFTLMRLSRFNETTALLAAGTPLLRIAASVVIAGVILNLLMLPIDQEILIPRMIPKLIREHNDVHRVSLKTFPVQMMTDANHGLFNAGMYYPASADGPAHIQTLDVIERDAQLHPTAHLYADSAIWDAPQRRWDLANGRRSPITPPDQPAPTVGLVKVDVYQSDITPDEIALNLGKDYIQLLPVSKINQLLDLKRYGTLDLLRVKHLRFAQPLANVILLLLAISTVLTRQPGTLKTAAVRCMTLTGLCMGSVFIGYQLAATPPPNNPDLFNLWPALMTWMPVFIFGPLAVYLLDRVKT